ncbi:alpha/beta fold hydrolase [Streptomyces sp. p1417]|uniref:Alpha/beta fold hydrolase n=1 Tax=Streptomyces typhae TaxID=2681492 RepID=A0A6L6WQK8_9ACTN|nr:alpha/beta fold hydrolase [Streptomyces typhae]
MRRVDIGGVPHHVRVSGGGPVCVLSAGLGLACREWDPVVALLARSRTVVRFDRPGLGRSGPARRAPTLVGEAERIGRVLDALGFGGEAVTVVGHSLAGLHAEAFARLCPGRTAGLVLVDSSVEEGARAVPFREARLALARGAAGALGALGVPRAVGPLARRVAGARSATPPTREQWALYGSRRVWRAALTEYATYGDVAHELDLMRREGAPLPGATPVAVLAATPRPTPAHDPWIRRQQHLATILGADFHVLAPAGHLLMRDRPHEVTEAILTTTH